MWTRTAIDQPLSFVDEYGYLLPLKMGTTFYQVIGLNSMVTNDDKDWGFEFN